MSEERDPLPGNSVLNDTRVTAEAGAHQTVIRIEQPKESPWKHPAVYIAILALVISIGGEWRRWIALDDIRDKQHDYYEEINVWETDNFNREKDIDSYLRANIGVDAVQLFGKPKPPPVPKEK